MRSGKSFRCMLDSGRAQRELRPSAPVGRLKPDASENIKPSSGISNSAAPLNRRPTIVPPNRRPRRLPARRTGVRQCGRVGFDPGIQRRRGAACTCGSSTTKWFRSRSAASRTYLHLGAGLVVCQPCRNAAVRRADAVRSRCTIITFAHRNLRLLSWPTWPSTCRCSGPRIAQGWHTMACNTDANRAAGRRRAHRELFPECTRAWAEAVSGTAKSGASGAAGSSHQAPRR